MGQIACRNRQDLTSPSVAYERAFELCRKSVMLEKDTKIYVGASITSLTHKGDFGSWLWKLFHRKKVSIHLHYYERLVRIVEDLTDEKRAQIVHLEELIRIAKGKRDAAIEGDVTTDLSMERIQSEAR